MHGLSYCSDKKYFVRRCCSNYLVDNGMFHVDDDTDDIQPAPVHSDMMALDEQHDYIRCKDDGGVTHKVIPHI